MSIANVCICKEQIECLIKLHLGIKQFLSGTLAVPLMPRWNTGHCVTVSSPV